MRGGTAGKCAVARTGWVWKSTPGIHNQVQRAFKNPLFLPHPAFALSPCFHLGKSEACLESCFLLSSLFLPLLNSKSTAPLHTSSLNSESYSQVLTRRFHLEVTLPQPMWLRLSSSHCPNQIPPLQELALSRNQEVILDIFLTSLPYPLLGSANSAS